MNSDKDTILAIASNLERVADGIEKPEELRDTIQAIRRGVDALRELSDEREAALEVMWRYGQIDGGHHKAWVIDQTVRKLTGERYEEWVRDRKAGEDGPETYEWYEGDRSVKYDAEKFRKLAGKLLFSISLLDADKRNTLHCGLDLGEELSKALHCAVDEAERLRSGLPRLAKAQEAEIKGLRTENADLKASLLLADECRECSEERPEYCESCAEYLANEDLAQDEETKSDTEVEALIDSGNTVLGGM